MVQSVFLQGYACTGQTIPSRLLQYVLTLLPMPCQCQVSPILVTHMDASSNPDALFLPLRSHTDVPAPSTWSW